MSFLQLLLDKSLLIHGLTLLSEKKTELLNLFVKKTVIMTSDITVNGSALEMMSTAKLLGVVLDSHLSFTPHVNGIHVCDKAKK